MRSFLPIVLLASIVCGGELFAYPSAEITGTGTGFPPISFAATSTVTGYLLTSDSQLVLSYNELVKLADMGSFALEAVQPPAPNTTDKTDGLIAGISYDSNGNSILASQEDGDMLIFDLTNVSATPQVVTVAAGKKLGPIVADLNGQYAYVADNTDRKIHVVNMADGSIKSSIAITIGTLTEFTVTDGIFVDATDEAYFTTSVGYVIYMSSGAGSLSTIKIGDNLNLPSLAAFPNGDYIYVVDQTTPKVKKISTSSHAVVTTDMDLSENANPTDIVVTNVANPTNTYAYVAGSYGVSFIDAGDDRVLDMGTDPDRDREPLPTSYEPYLLAASSSADGYVYMSFSTGSTGVISANPWVVISGLTYSSGGDHLGLGENFTVTFQSNQDGTYEVRCGGSVDAGGTLLRDQSGSTGGSIIANTDTSATFNYDDNKAAFAEGDNDLFIFVTAGSNRGRRSTNLAVDTPPDAVTIRSTGFGDGKVYVTFDRLTAEDVTTYRFYADTTEQGALTKADVSATAAQAASGSTQTGEVGGLSNGTLYYIAVEAVDAGGNVSPTRSVTSETPSQTLGVAGLLGQGNSCSVMPGRNGPGIVALLIFVASAAFLIVWRRRAAVIPIVVLAVVLLSGARALAQEQPIVEKSVSSHDSARRPSPQMWEVELKTGFWMPQNSVLNQVFTPCCNMITRLQGGFLYKGRYGIGGGVGFLYKTANALGTGAHEGEQSSDRFSFILIPFETNFTFRAQFPQIKYVIPYARAGLDYVYFREGIHGSSTKGFKYGMHGTGGVQIDIGSIADVAFSSDEDFGINDFYLTLEGQYQWINNFGGGGLDLSGPVCSIGLLFEF